MFDLDSEIRKYKPSSDREVLMVAQTIQFIEQNPSNHLSRSNLFGHVTAGAWILNKERTHVLLTYDKKIKKWLHFGGHCDGEDVLTAALREAKGESGLTSLKVLSESIFDVDVHASSSPLSTHTHLHFDIRFLFEADQQEELIISRESIDLKWYDLSELKYDYEMPIEEHWKNLVKKAWNL